MTEDELMTAIHVHELHVKQCQLLRQEPTAEARANLLEAIEMTVKLRDEERGLIWIKTADLGLLHAKAAMCDAIRGLAETDEHLVDRLCVDDGSGNAWMPRDEGERLRDALSTLRRLENKP